jgi:F-type H+-transporting ATPase subunit gamma
LEVSGKRGISAFKYRQAEMQRTYTRFEDKPKYDEVEELADRYLEMFVTGQIDRLDVAYTKFFNPAKQEAVVETLLPLGEFEGAEKHGPNATNVQYEFLPSAASILEEVVPMSFRVKLFKCFLDAAVSEQIARMVAMKAATENADSLIKSLTRTYNRARQSQITSEILEVLGGSEALAK